MKDGRDCGVVPFLPREALSSGRRVRQPVRLLPLLF